MFNTGLNHPTIFNLLDGLRPRLAQALADRRRRAETRHAERRLEAELASMSAHERMDLDVMSGNRGSSRPVRRA